MKATPYGLKFSSIQWPKEHKEEEETISYGLRLASNQWQKECKRECESNSLQIKIFFHLMAKRT